MVMLPPTSERDYWICQKVGEATSVKVTNVGESNDVNVEIDIPYNCMSDKCKLNLALKKEFVSGSNYAKTIKMAADLKEPEVKSKTPSSTWKRSSDGKSATVTMKVTFTEKLAKEEDGEYVLLTSGTDLKNWFAIDKDAYTLDSAIYTSGGTPYITFKFTYDLTKAASEARNVGMVSAKKLYDKLGYELTWPGIVVKADSKMVQWK